MKAPHAALGLNPGRCDSETSVEKPHVLRQSSDRVVTCEGFDRLAPIYDLMECVSAGRLMMKVRTAFLEKWPDEGEVLLVGEGHGRFLAHLRVAKPHLRITYLDASLKMLSIARRRLQQSGISEKLTTFVHADIRSWQPQPFDVISTQFFLDCFEGDELKDVIQRLSQSAKPDARWFLADFQIPSHGFPRLRANLIVWLMYRFFRALTGLPAKRLDSPLPILRDMGFSQTVRQEWNLGLLYASWWTR